MRRLIQFGFLTLFIIMIPSYSSAGEHDEWIVHFTNSQSAQNFSIEHSANVIDRYSRFVKVHNITKEELLNNSSVLKVEPNYKKESAIDLTNDPLYPSQWYLNQINFSDVAYKYPHKPLNLLLNQEIEIDSVQELYKGQKLYPKGNSIAFKNNQRVLSRISVTVNLASNGGWTLRIKDSKGIPISENSGFNNQLDVLIPQQEYSSFEIELTSNNNEPITVEEIVGVNHATIAVLDSGVADHEDFCGNILYSLGKNYYEEGLLPIDKYGHGTHVAGIIGACNNNNTGITGIIGNAPVDIIPFKVLNDTGLGGDFEISQGVEDAIGLNVDVINLSLAGKGKTTILEKSLQKAFHENIPVVVAAGNWNISTDEVYPASYPYVITVASLNKQSEKLATSNYGLAVDVSAPGEMILSTYINNTYKTLSGTSMAVPMVSSAIALLEMKHTEPELDIVTMRGKLFQSVEDLYSKGHDKTSGQGLIDLNKIVNTDPSTKKIEWLDVYEDSPVTHKTSTLGISTSLKGKELLIIEDEKTLMRKELDDNLEEIALNLNPTFSKTKVVTIVKDANNIHSIDYLYIENPEINSGTFSDVNTKYWAHDEIMNASSNGFINGYTDGTFQPQKNISRRHATMMMNRLFRWDSLKELTSPFIDVQITENLTFDTLSLLSAFNEGVINGYESKEFKPENSLTRGQMALILARALEVESKLTSTNNHQFEDLPESGEIVIPINNLTSMGIITDQKLYRPNDFITRAQFAAMINRTYDYLINK
jgi:subtilisin family serine protease